MKISLVTPSFNQGRFIARTIDSVLAQHGDFELDYTVIDGGSTDDTLDILRSYGTRIRWRSERDAGQVDAINKGLRGTTGDVVGWLNSDDVLLPRALERVAAAFAANPRTEWVHGRCLIIDEHDREVRRWITAYKHFRSQRHTFENFLTENYVSQMAAFWRRGVHDEIGFLDPAIKLAFDYDLFLRLAQRGAPVYIEHSLACFRWYETSKSGNGFVAQLRETNEIAAGYAESKAWTRARARMKKIAIINIYRAMGLARATFGRYPGDGILAR